jgi:sialate O-acetylesterase
MTKILLPLLLLLGPAGSLGAQPCSLFSSGAVLQRNRTVAVWGHAEPGARARLRAPWLAAPLDAQADAQGRYEFALPTPGAGGPHRLELRVGEVVHRVEDVLIGEVWLASGQSNMEWSLRRTRRKEVTPEAHDAELARHEDPMIRYFVVRNSVDARPRRWCSGSWEAARMPRLAGFSATAFWFAHRLRERLGVPVGIVQSDWGGTRAAAWSPRAALEGFDRYREPLARLAKMAEGEPLEKPERLNQHTPSALFNAMIAPLQPWGLRGFLWYQGESDRSRSAHYADLFPAMITRWRAGFGQGDLPFYYVQIAPFGYKGDRGEAGAMRDVQRRCSGHLPNLGMVSTLDVGNPADIHPKDKKTVGRRLARWALRRCYGELDLVASGPRPVESRADGARVELRFAECRGGLALDARARQLFELRDAEGAWHRARVEVVAPDRLRLEAEGVGTPTAVRFAHGAADEGVLRAAAGLPAPSFVVEVGPGR